MHIRSSLVTQVELQDSIISALYQLENLPVQNPAETAYRFGFRAALQTIATAHGLNIPQLRNAEAAAVARNHMPTHYDMRL